MVNAKHDNTNKVQHVLIPMLVDRNVLAENGLIAGVTHSKIRKWKIGNRNIEVLLVPGTKEQSQAIMAEYSRQFKAEDRDKRCAVPGERGKLIRCPEDNKCSRCPYYLTREEYGTVLFSSLAQVDEDGDMQDYDPASPTNYNEANRELRLLADLIHHLSEIAPAYGIMIQLLHEGYSRREVADKMGLPKSTVIDKVKKLKSLTESFFDNLTY